MRLRVPKWRSWAVGGGRRGAAAGGAARAVDGGRLAIAGPAAADDDGGDDARDARDAVITLRGHRTVLSAAPRPETAI
ncbi:MAG: hypothetical protein ACT4RN_23440, partial [Pseudonocardia sp.]